MKEIKTFNEAVKFIADKVGVYELGIARDFTEKDIIEIANTVIANDKEKIQSADEIF